MKLKFRIEPLKIKPPRILVSRLSQKEGQYAEKVIGRYYVDADNRELLAQLTPEERYEFDNFVKTLQFAKTQFNCNADKLDRLIIKVAPELKDAFFKLWEKAREYNLDFIPEEEMLNAVLNRAKLVEQQLNLLTDGDFKALEAFHLDITDFNPFKKDPSEDQKLFLAAIEAAPSVEALADLFNSITKEKYQKPASFKPHYFNYYVQSPTPHQKAPSFLKWYCTIAIDALLKLGKDPTAIVSPALIAEHWLRLNKKSTFPLTVKAFHQQFPQLKTDKTSAVAIKKIFIDEELSKMANQPPTTTPIPSFALEKWLKRWKEKNAKATLSQTLQAFAKEFPLVGENPFLISLIQKTYETKN